MGTRLLAYPYSLNQHRRHRRHLRRRRKYEINTRRGLRATPKEIFGFGRY